MNWLKDIRVFARQVAISGSVNSTGRCGVAGGSWLVNRRRGVFTKLICTLRTHTMCGGKRKLR